MNVIIPSKDSNEQQQKVQKQLKSIKNTPQKKTYQIATNEDERVDFLCETPQSGMLEMCCCSTACRMQQYKQTLTQNITVTYAYQCECLSAFFAFINCGKKFICQNTANEFDTHTQGNKQTAFFVFLYFSFFLKQNPKNDYYS